jgi:hypothetical protein
MLSPHARPVMQDHATHAGPVLTVNHQRGEAISAFAKIHKRVVNVEKLHCDFLDCFEKWAACDYC